MTRPLCTWLLLWAARLWLCLAPPTRPCMPPTPAALWWSSPHLPLDRGPPMGPVLWRATWLPLMCRRSGRRARGCWVWRAPHEPENRVRLLGSAYFRRRRRARVGPAGPAACAAAVPGRWAARPRAARAGGAPRSSGRPAVDHARAEPVAPLSARAAEITCLVGPWARPALRGNPDVDRLLAVPFPGLPGLPADPTRWAPTWLPCATR